MTQISLATANVDTPTAEYIRAHVQVETRIIVVRNLVGVVLEVLNLDEDVETITLADIPGTVYRGTVDGVAVVVRETQECQCGGTRKRLK